jgi:hypothetical protein
MAMASVSCWRECTPNVWTGRCRYGPLAWLAEVTEGLQHPIAAPSAAPVFEDLDRLEQLLDCCSPVLRHQATPQQGETASPKGLIANSGSPPRSCFN